jgi:exopolyphosphatase/guanosine-5'-triphosphate,3'-diphosphate pyrophosphatase
MSDLVDEIHSVKAAGRYAVIDVGSNSIRLVIFEGLNRSLNVIFNEKIACGLGSDLAVTGCLSTTGVCQAIMNLGRFSNLLLAMDVKLTDAVATAAVRDATNGAVFVARVEREVGIRLRVLTGTEEAEYTALGVVASVAGAQGLMADLGGGSLELAEVDGRNVGNTATLPFGSLRFSAENRDELRGQLEQMADELGNLEWLARHKGQNMYLVGGTWRSLARLHMVQTQYPLQVVHQYSLTYKHSLEFLKLLSIQSSASLDSGSQISSRRLALIPLSAEILSIIMERVQPSRVVFVAGGLREGLAFDRLTPAEKSRDPLIAVCMDLANRAARFPGHGRELADWLAPIFPLETLEQARLRRAVCLLSDTAWSVHPGYRAEYALMESALMQAPIDHFGRSFLGLATMTRYSRRRIPKFAREIESLMCPEIVVQARALGLAARVGETLSGGVPGILENFSLLLDEKEVVLACSRGDSALVGHVVRERFKALATHLQLKHHYDIK